MWLTIEWFIIITVLPSAPDSLRKTKLSSTVEQFYIVADTTVSRCQSLIRARIDETKRPMFIHETRLRAACVTMRVAATELPVCLRLHKCEMGVFHRDLPKYTVHNDRDRSTPCMCATICQNLILFFNESPIGSPKPRWHVGCNLEEKVCSALQICVCIWNQILYETANPFIWQI